MVPIYALTCASIISGVYAHSWLECSNYDPPMLNITAAVKFNEEACNGYPRGFARQFINGFGVETGYSWPHNDCTRDAFNNKDYTSTTPMATYIPSQIIYLAHPAKKHVADICTGANVPPVSISLSMSSDIDIDTFDTEIDMFGPDHINGKIDHAGYQFCFDFCSNPDKALCLTSWVIPDNITEGIHSFKWTVRFNTSDYYSTCFDAMVASVDTIDAIDNESYGSFSNIDDNDTVVISDLLSETSSKTSSRSLINAQETIIIPKLNLSIEHRPLIHHLTTRNATHNVSIAFRPTISTRNYTTNSTNITIIHQTNNTITFPTKTVKPIPTILPTPTPYPIPLTLPPEVITSDANHQSPPFSNITNYLIGFIGRIDIRGMFNITTRSFGRL